MRSLRGFLIYRKRLLLKQVDLLEHYRSCRKAKLEADNTSGLLRKYRLRQMRFHLRRMREGWGSEITPEAELGDVIIRHGTAIVIGGGARIADGVIIHQQVVLGALRFGGPERRGIICHQHIGENTILCAGAKILGDVTIGKNCIIGANAVVTCDVPDNSVAVGHNRILEGKNIRET